MLDIHYISELVDNLDIDNELLLEPENLGSGSIQVVLKDVPIETIIERIKSDKYYNSLVDTINVDSISLIERYYISNHWVWIATVFEEDDLGCVITSSILSVSYFSELGDNINVPSIEMAESLRRADLEEAL